MPLYYIFCSMRLRLQQVGIYCRMPVMRHAGNLVLKEACCFLVDVGAYVITNAIPQIRSSNCVICLLEYIPNIPVAALSCPLGPWSLQPLNPKSKPCACV